MVNAEALPSATEAKDIFLRNTIAPKQSVQELRLQSSSLFLIYQRERDNDLPSIQSDMDATPRVCWVSLVIKWALCYIHAEFSLSLNAFSMH